MPQTCNSLFNLIWYIKLAILNCALQFQYVLGQPINMSCPCFCYSIEAGLEKHILSCEFELGGYSVSQTNLLKL